MSNVNLVYRVLQEAGYQPHQIAGVIGRLQQESGMKLNPSVRGDDGTAFGIAQWREGRVNALKSFAKQSGQDWNNPETQARFIVHELNTTERRAGDMLRNAKTVEEASKAAMAYERPAGFNWLDPTMGHGWKNTIQNASNIASGAGLAPGQIAAAPTPGTTLTSNPVAAAPVAAAPTNPTFDLTTKEGVQAALGNDKFMGTLKGITGGFNRQANPQEAAAAAQITPMNSGFDNQQAAGKSAAATILSSLLQKRGGPRGLTLGAPGMMG